MRRIKRVINVIVIILICTSVINGSEIHDAARRGDLRKIKLLISNNPQLINEKDDEGDININRILENNNSVLHQAVSGGSSEIVDKLFEKSPDINARNIFGCTPLHVAVKEGHTDIVLQLIDNKADINARTRIGETTALMDYICSLMDPRTALGVHFGSGLIRSLKN